MEGYLQADRGSCTTKQDGQAHVPSIELNQPGPVGHFATLMDQVLQGDSEPDPLFFVESWTIGVPAAVQNLQQRRQWQQDRRHQTHTFNKFHNLRTLSFIEERGIDTEIFPSSGVASIADTFASGLPPQSQEMPAQSPVSQDSDTFATDWDSIQRTPGPMTLQGARRLLATNPTSTREQIKAAYHKMAGRYHPDRFERGSDRERQLGTDRMAAINESYRLLCS